MKIIMTGATGFIGSYLLERLLNDKAVTKLLLIAKDINKLNKRFLKNSKIRVIELSLTRENIPAIPGYDVLVHLADMIPGREDVSNFSDNIKITENVINNIIIKKIVKKIVYTSTLDVYGKPDSLPIVESHGTNPLTFYGISKLASEMFIKKAMERVKLNYIILRLSQVYGPQEPLVKVIPLLVKKIQDNEYIKLNNKGNIIRDWVYIKDVSSAIEQSIYSEASGIFNIATGKGYSLKELVDLLGDILHKTPKIRSEKKNKDPRPKIVLNIRKANRYLDYYPKYDLKRGLSDYLAERT